MARAWRGLEAFLAWVARAWRGHGTGVAGMSCDPSRGTRTLDIPEWGVGVTLEMPPSTVVVVVAGAFPAATKCSRYGGPIRGGPPPHTLRAVLAVSLCTAY
eukprot:gene10999-biopygen7811